ncbi:MAG: hypothetical protein KUG56_07230 [Kordiimonadaceae bacterium]|nr:hypothetical protein [Kordiimonadaceae bacterium]
MSLPYMLQPVLKDNLLSVSQIEPNHRAAYEECVENLVKIGCRRLDAAVILRALFALKQWKHNFKRVEQSKNPLAATRRFERTLLSKGIRASVARKHTAAYMDVYFNLLLSSLVKEANCEKLDMSITDAMDLFLAIANVVPTSSGKYKDKTTLRRKSLQERFRNFNRSHPTENIHAAAEQIHRDFVQLFADIA